MRLHHRLLVNFLMGGYARAGTEFFEVYSPIISTVYGQVYWTAMDAVPLPPDIVKKFAGKTMAIVGYESDTVRRTPDGDVPLPITAAYNHHYTGYIRQAGAKKVPLDVQNGAAAVGHAEPDGRYYHYVDGEGKRAGVAMHEGNGGEFRQSYHGFPHGWGQCS